MTNKPGDMDSAALAKMNLLLTALGLLLLTSRAMGSGPSEWKQIEIQPRPDVTDEPPVNQTRPRFLGVSLNLLNVTYSIWGDGGGYGNEFTLFTPGARIAYDKLILKYFSFGVVADAFVFVDGIPWEVSNGILVRIGIRPQLVISIKNRVYLHLGCIVGGNLGNKFKAHDAGVGVFFKPILGAKIFFTNWGGTIDFAPGADWIWGIEGDVMAVATAVQINVGAVYRF
ncbi:MAG: hypothetical protein JXX14_02280 [Deltaproteobacteria bacterium]|nr:hypothetical protein [Deltaproteobacteria bacterium]